MNKKKRRKYIIVAVTVILISIIALIGTTYALLTTSVAGGKEVTLTVGILKVDFTEGNRINLNNAAPMTDTQGQATTPYTFTIDNTGNVPAYYHISLEEARSNTLANSYVKMQLTGDNGYNSGVVKVSSLGSGTFDITNEATLKAGSDVTFQLRMWLDSSAPNSVQGKTYQSKIVVTSYDRAQ